jgi:2-aminoethylphosphonate-pyruvate transaminase
VRTVLLNPGPVTLSDRVRKALVRGDWCHREPEFAELTQSIATRLEGLYEHDSARRHRAVLLTGSGTCAVEAMIWTCLPYSQKTLVVANGVYGERIAAMVHAQGGKAVVSSFPWTGMVELEAVEDCLRRDPSITHVIAVHHETTTGRLNDLQGLGELCKQYGRRLLVDAVSSFGAEEIKFSEWNIAAVAATANKCLHAAPGIAFVLADEDVLRDQRRHSSPVYLDLKSYYALQSESGYSPFTPCVPSAFALDEALEEHRKLGGWRSRRERYRAIGGRIREKFASLGVELLLPVEAYGSALYSYRLPRTITYRELHDRLKAAGFVIYAGQGCLAEEIFRIAHMGDIRDRDIDNLEHRLAAIFGSSSGVRCGRL